MANQSWGFGKPKSQRTAPREIEPSSAAPDLAQDNPEPVAADDNESAAGRQTSEPMSDRIAKGIAGKDIPRRRLNDVQWRRQSPFRTGKQGGRGRTARNSRSTLEGILWALRTGAPWRDLPARFGKWNSVYRSFRRWRQRGVFRRLFLSLGQDLNLRVLLVDGAFVKAHQRSVGAPKADGRTTSPARRKSRRPDHQSDAAG